LAGKEELEITGKRTARKSKNPNSKKQNQKRRKGLHSPTCLCRCQERVGREDKTKEERKIKNPQTVENREEETIAH